MRRPLLTLAAIAATLLIAAVVAAQTPDATAIVARADKLIRGDTSYAAYSMELVRPDWTRTLSMKTWSKNRDRALILITGPARDKGTTYLKRGNEIWNWVPSVERVIKIPPSMMSQPWLGSDFTNDDLVKESSMVTDYTHTITGDTTIAGRDCWRIRMIPKPDAAVVWGKVVLFVSKQHDLELLVRYYDEDDALVNELRGTQVKDLGGRLIPTVLTMTPVDKPGQHTILTYKDAWFDRPLDDGFFSEQNLKRVH
jgi:outer membrane lipoprotein-sorting protein